MQQRPALLFAGTPWDSNIFEFFGTTMMPMFQTATMTGLLDPGVSLCIYIPIDQHALVLAPSCNIACAASTHAANLPHVSISDTRRSLRAAAADASCDIHCM